MGFTCRRVLIPDQVDWIAIVGGCLLDLTYARNFEQFGTATPAETAAIFSVMFDKFSLEGACHMIGEVIAWAGSDGPPDDGLILCDGRSVSQSDYPALWEVIGLTYGGTDETDFLLPDLRGKTIISASDDFDLADSGGEIEHTLTTAEMPAHTHTEVTAVPAIINGGLEAPASSATPSTGITGSSGDGGAHNNMQPYLALRYYIQAK